MTQYLGLAQERQFPALLTPGSAEVHLGPIRTFGPILGTEE